MAKPRILAIDDDISTLQLLVEMLRGKGYHLRATLNGVDGYHKAVENVPDLILLDINMPELDGHHLCRLLRENPETRNVPIIFLTGRSTLPDKLEGFASGCNDYIVKPYHAEEVVARIQAQLMMQCSREEDTDPQRGVDLEGAEVSHNEKLLQRAVDLLLEQMEDPPPLRELARMVHSNDRTLTDLFYQAYGLSVFAWLRRERLKRACTLLLESSHPVSEVAAMVGFSHAAFSTAFKEQYGVTPSDYRKMGGASVIPDGMD